MIPVRTAIRRVRDRSPRFNSQEHPDEVLLGFFSDLQRRLFMQAVSIDRRFGRTKQAYPLPLADFDAGATIPANLHVLGATWNPPAPPPGPPPPIPPAALPVVLRRYEDRLTPRLWPAAYVHGANWFPMGLESEWQSGSVDVEYVPTPADLTLAGALAMPDEAGECFTAAGVLFLTGRLRNPEATPEQVQGRVVEATRAEKAFLARVEAGLTFDQR